MEKEENRIFEIHNYLEIEGSPKEVIEKIIKDVPDLEDIGFAGYLEKKWLKMNLRRLILDRKGNNPPYFYNAEYGKEIRLICGETIKRCKRYLKDKIHIFLFPTFDEFAIKNINGISGFCSWGNTILIFINFTERWEKYLKETIVHELAHALSPYAKPNASIGSWLILEGLAEHFKDFILSGNRSSWTKTVSEDEAWRIFDEVKDIIKETDFDKYSEIFYGTGKYHMWAEYTIGYYLIKKYLKDKKDIDWNNLLKIDPKKILGEFNV